MERQSLSSEKQRAFSRKSLLLAACMTISAGTSAAALAIAQSGCGSFSSADTEQEAGSNEGGSDGGNDGGGSGTDSGNAPDVGVIVDAGEAGVDAGDPCAEAVVTGFSVKLKGLPNNKYDYVLYRDGGVYKESVSNGVNETGDTVLSPVKYDDILVVQSMPDVSGAPEAEKYAMEDDVNVSADCITQASQTVGIGAYTTINFSDFQLIRDACPQCTLIGSSAVKPTFHYEYRKTSYLSTAYHITFKKP